MHSRAPVTRVGLRHGLRAGVNVKESRCSSEQWVEACSAASTWRYRTCTERDTGRRIFGGVLYHARPRIPSAYAAFSGYSRRDEECRRGEHRVRLAAPFVRLLMGVSFLQLGFLSWGFYAWQPYFLRTLGPRCGVGRRCGGGGDGPLHNRRKYRCRLVQPVLRPAHILLLSAAGVQTVAAIGVGLPGSVLACCYSFSFSLLRRWGSLDRSAGVHYAIDAIRRKGVGNLFRFDGGDMPAESGPVRPGLSVSRCPSRSKKDLWRGEDATVLVYSLAHFSAFPSASELISSLGKRCGMLGYLHCLGPAAGRAGGHDPREAAG